MITNDQKQFIRKHVKTDHYDCERLIKYLSMHDIVGVEIFHYCEKDVSKGQRTLSSYFEKDDTFVPLSINAFVRRIPFLFYTATPNEKDGISSMGDLFFILQAAVEKWLDNPTYIDRIFGILEHLYYDLHLPLEHVFSYWIDQTELVRNDTFFQWAHYINLVEGRDNPDYFPERLITAYNIALEEAGLSPVIYEIQDMGMCEPFFRNGNVFQFEGCFPCDDAGRPIMKWIGLKVKNEAIITCKCQKSRKGQLIIEVTPKTIIHALNFYNNKEEDDDVWYQLYAGPLNMEFDYQALHDNRERLGYTQQQVADAIGTSVRTYQKWEAGQSTPNGYFLIRILNWLDIFDIQHIVKYQEE